MSNRFLVNMGIGFGTSVSPWVVTMDALQPHRCAPKTKQDPPPFDHLKWPTEQDATFDIKLEIELIRKYYSMVNNFIFINLLISDYKPRGRKKPLTCNQ